MSLDLALNVARSGLAAVQRGLAQNAQNVANADTPGYTRKAAAREALVAGGAPTGVRTAPESRASRGRYIQKPSRYRSSQRQPREGRLCGPDVQSRGVVACRGAEPGGMRRGAGSARPRRGGGGGGGGGGTTPPMPGA